MSRSRRKRPFFGNTGAQSERGAKKRAHKRLRMRNFMAAMQALRDEADPEIESRMRSVSDRYWWPKDGKSYRPQVADSPEDMAK